jgi:hypothetical protein
MAALLRPALLAFLWSLGSFAALSYFILDQNPFVGTVLCTLIIAMLIVQLIVIRKRGLPFISTFIGCLIGFYLLFSYADDRFGSHKSRYYSVVKR